MGKLLIIIGILCTILGVFIEYGGKIPFFGKLPGDIVVTKDNFKIYFPITTSIIISIFISIVLYVYHRFKN